MNELIKVDFSADRLLVSARELHQFLEVDTPYRKWFPRMCEYGFTEGTDFNPVKNVRVQREGSRSVSREIDDAAITIDMAKEICMIQRNEKGKIARQYFLKLEKDWNSPEKVMARALRIADAKITALQEANTALEHQARLDAPKVMFADSVAASDDTILIGELAKILRQNGVNIGQNRLFDWLRQNGFLIRRPGTDYNVPTQRAMDMGLFRLKETVITHSSGKVSTTITAKVTGKGQTYFLSRFLKAKA